MSIDVTAYLELEVIFDVEANPSTTFIWFVNKLDFVAWYINMLQEKRVVFQSRF